MDQQQQQYTHAAIPIAVFNAIVKYFRETPMPRMQSDPYIEVLGQARFVKLEQQDSDTLKDG